MIGTFAILMACQKEIPAPKPSSTQAPPPIAAPTTDPASGNDAADIPLVLPGKFNATMTIADLERYFGKGHVREGEIPGAEGAEISGIIVFPDDPTRRAYLYPHPDDPKRGFLNLRIFDQQSQWQIEGGIRIGSSLADVLRVNGRAFEFGGTGWDYGGYASDWGTGKLQRKAQDPTPVVRFELTEAFMTAHQDGAMPSGEGVFRTDDPRWPDLDMEVTEIGLSFRSR